MTDTGKRPRGRPPTGAAHRTIRLPAELAQAWDSAGPEKVRAVLMAALVDA